MTPLVDRLFQKLGTLELGGFLLLCVGVAASPALAYFAVHSLDGAEAPSRWYDGGVYLSWAFLIYFSWACLPSRELPARARLRAWVLFFLLELAYPAVSWLLEGGTRLHVFADVTSYFSTNIALSAGALLTIRGASLLRGGDWGILVPLAFVAFFIVLPGLSVEWDWWQVVELPHGDGLSQGLRAAGVLSGAAGVFRNLRRSSLFR
ncbi:MAG: hypothetical protein JNJ54_16255 [Myxococcaceae bacterium]|nr:hypothetical protein [Myxococcaceae bacterium]